MTEYCLTDEEYTALYNYIYDHEEDIKMGEHDFGNLTPLLSILEPQSSVVEFH